MLQYGTGIRTINTYLNSTALEIKTTLANKTRVLEFGFSQFVATASVFGLGRSSSVGVSPLFTQNFIDEGDGTAAPSQTVVAVAWGVMPGVPANYNRRVSTIANIGAGAIYIFPRGFAIPSNASLCLFNITANAVIDVYAVIDE